MRKLRSLIKRIVRIFYRKPDLLIGDQSDPYMRRWWVIPRNRWFNVYLHNIVKDDDDRALHDHPWASLSFLFKGSYNEVTPQGSKIFKRGSFIFRGSEYTHRLELLEDRSCWTLFITGPKVREWGFWCPSGWKHWREFTDVSGASVGAGCGEDDRPKETINES